MRSAGSTEKAASVGGASRGGGQPDVRIGESVPVKVGGAAATAAATAVSAAPSLASSDAVSIDQWNGL